MFSAYVNYVAVLVAAVANMGLGMLWYSPILFGKPWMKLMGLTEKKMESAKKEMGKLYLLATLGALVMAYVLAVLIDYTQVVTLAEGLQLAAMVWLGFIAPTMLTSVLWEGKSVNLYLINVGYQLAALLSMGLILTLWV